MPLKRADFAPFSNFLAALWKNYRAPFLSVISLALICLDTRSHPDAFDASLAAYLISRYIYGAFLLVCLVALWLPSRQTKTRVRPSAWWWADVVLFTYTVVPLLQLTVPSPRPPGSPIQGLGGFPSGHQTSMFALAWLISVARPRWALPAWALTALIGWARLESHSHYLYQVLSGGVLGTGLGWWIATRPQGVFLPRILGWPSRLLSRKTGGNSS